MQESEKKLEEIREKYLVMSRRAEQMPELEIKLRSVSSINVELEKRVNDLIEINENLKMDFSSRELSQRRFTQVESDLRKCHGLLEDKEVEIGELKGTVATWKE